MPFIQTMKQDHPINQGNAATEMLPLFNSDTTQEFKVGREKMAYPYLAFSTQNIAFVNE